MKTIILSLAVIASLTVTSCRKERTCTCKYTSTTNGQGSTSEQKNTQGHVTKRELKKTTGCYSTKSTQTQTFGGQTFTTDNVSECSID